MQNGVSLNAYEGEIQAKKCEEEGDKQKISQEEKRERRKERKNEEKEKDERFSKSKWEWSLSF